MKIFYHTRREEKGKALEPIFVFPLVGQLLLDNDDIRTVKARATLERCTRLHGCAQRLPSQSLWMFKGSNYKPEKHEPFQRGWSLSLAFLFVLVGTIWAPEVNYLQVHFGCMQWSEFPISLLQV